MISRPQKAPTVPITDEQLRLFEYPVVGSAKLDGFRCITDLTAHTSSMKEFQNKFVQRELSKPIFNNLDGELVIGEPFKTNEDDDVFNRTSGPLRRYEGDPDFKFYIFDRPVGDTYHSRWFMAEKPKDPRIVVLEQRVLMNPQDVIRFEEEMVNLGYEGAMIRSLEGYYKQGRCTLREMNIFKRKPFEDCEAVIIGFEEEMENTNPQMVNELGLMKRSHRAEGMIPKGTLGSFLLKSIHWEKPFNAKLGRGFSAKDAQRIWNTKEVFLGQLATVHYQKYGSLEKPRSPKVTKLRPIWDLEDRIG